MEIEEFLDQDIQRFLDVRTQEPITAAPKVQSAAITSVFLTRDYEKELLQALQMDDISRAKRTLHDLKERFDECPNGTTDKQQLKALLLALYDRLKEYMDTQHTREEIDALVMPGAVPHKELPVSPSAIPVPPPAAKASVPAPVAPVQPLVVIPAPAPVHDPLVAVHDALDATESALHDGMPLMAMRHYRDARREALSASHIPDDLANRFGTLFDRIKHAVPSAPVPSHHENTLVAVPPPTTVQDMDRQLLLQLEREKRTLDEFLAKDDFPGAMRQYRTMRVIAQQMHDSHLAETTAQKLVRIHELISKMHSHLTADDRALAPKVP